MAGGKAPRRRLRIAVLLDHLNSFSGGYEAQLRDAIHAACREAGHHLLLVYGGPVEAPQPLVAADNAIYELLRADSVDGIIVVSSLLSTYCGPAGVARLVKRFGHARMCSIGIELPGIPSLVLDNRPGMEAVVEHLIRDHRRRRIAFLEGTPENPEAKVRLQAYQNVLARHGIAFDPALTAPGYFRTNSAKAAMAEILARGVEIDSVVAANDEMATGAIDVLRKQGRRVPQDIPVTGFDDLTLARLGNPPLTTVAQPFDQVADWAVRAIEEQAAGLRLPARTEFAARFVRRQSCGCGYEAYRRDSPAAPQSQSAGKGSMTARLGTLWPVLAGLLGTDLQTGASAATRLLDGLRAEIGGRREAFHEAIVALLANAGTDNERQRMLHSAICYIRDELRGWSNLAIERVLFDGLDLVALSNTTSQMQHRLLLDENYLRLLGVGEQASVAFDLASLRDALVKGLPSAGVRNAYLACVAGRNVLRTVMHLRDGALVESENGEYTASQLLPPGALTNQTRETYLVFPLAFEDQLLGVIAFNYFDGINAYAAFRNEIAAALKSVRLREELVQTSMLHERSVQERAAATKRMEALSVLAGGVAHDLNNALGPLIALPDVILSQLWEIQGNQDTVRDLRNDVEAIKLASLRAVQTIKDLLTLGRQGRTAKENLDINRVIKSCWANNSLRFVEQNEAGTSRVKMSADLGPTPLVVRGSESQLARAVDNLIRNAVESLAGNGEVVVKSARVDVPEPRAGYEIVPAGRYAMLSVSDDGCGIERRDLGQVFEPFFTKKRAQESSGSGLGLAIVHGVVKEHEGYIDVTSTPGVGTTISLYLPIVDGAERREHVPVAPRGDGRILIVDDEAIQLRTGRRVLSRLGYEVEIMDSGMRAFELFRRAAASGHSPFDLVIIDMLLGEALDGLQIIEQIQRLFPAQKVIVASGHAPTEREALAVKKGLTWLTKPYSMDTLAQMVQQVLMDDSRHESAG